MGTALTDDQMRQLEGMIHKIDSLMNTLTNERAELVKTREDEFNRRSQNMLALATVQSEPEDNSQDNPQDEAQATQPRRGYVKAEPESSGEPEGFIEDGPKMWWRENKNQRKRLANWRAAIADQMRKQNAALRLAIEDFNRAVADDDEPPQPFQSLAIADDDAKRTESTEGGHHRNDGNRQRRDDRDRRDDRHGRNPQDDRRANRYRRSDCPRIRYKRRKREHEQRSKRRHRDDRVEEAD